jgi:probable rRNA maturation factor
MMDIASRDDLSSQDRADLERLAAEVFRGEGRTLRVSLCLVGEAEIHEVNREFLEHDHPTDVIAFDLRGEGPGGPEDVDGEIIVNLDLARTEGNRRGHGAHAELLLYVAHGLLHLLGHDDATSAERERMMGLQRRYLDALGVHIDS